MRVQVAIPEEHVSADVLDAALEGVTRLNENMLHAGQVPSFREAVDRVRWRPEPPGQEHFDHARIVYGRGWGDCDDLAPWHAASLRAKGEDPGAFAFVKPSGPNRWHAVVQRSDGSVDDPSREAGMGSGVSGVADEFGASLGVCGAAVPLMVAPPAGVGSYIARPQLAMRPVKGPYGKIEAWQARADLPWHWGPGQSPTDVAMAALHASPVSSQAIAGACFGASQLGAANDADEEHLDRLEAIGHMLEGASWGDVAYEYGPEHATAATHLVGSFFGSLKRGLGTVMHAASPLAHMALPFVPGVGPIAARAFDMAEPALQHLLRQGGHLPPRAMAYPAPRAYPQAYPVHPPFQHCEQSWHCYE